MWSVYCLTVSVSGSNLTTAIWENSACVVGQGTLPKVVWDNDFLVYLNYEYDTLNDLIATL